MLPPLPAAAHLLLPRAAIASQSITDEGYGGVYVVLLWVSLLPVSETCTAAVSPVCWRGCDKRVLKQVCFRMPCTRVFLVLGGFLLGWDRQ